MGIVLIKIYLQEFFFVHQLFIKHLLYASYFQGLMWTRKHVGLAPVLLDCDLVEKTEKKSYFRKLQSVVDMCYEKVYNEGVRESIFEEATFNSR